MSKIHHYIPRFLIRHFVDAENQLYIYNKQTGLIVRKGAGGVFWELNRNTNLIDGKQGQQMESVYQAVDDRFSKSLSATLRIGKLIEDHAMNLIMLAATLKWRVPAVDGEFDKYASELDYDKLPLDIVVKGTNQQAERAIIAHLTGSPIFSASKRVIFPFLCFYTNGLTDEAKVKAVFENLYLISDLRGKAILSDSPILEREPVDVHTFGEQLMTLSPQHTLIYNCSGSRQMHPLLFSLQRDILLFDQAKTYVACGDLDYLNSVKEAHQQGSQELFSQTREQLFRTI